MITRQVRLYQVLYIQPMRLQGGVRVKQFSRYFPSNSSFSPSSSTRSDLEHNLSLLLPFHLPAGYYCSRYFLFLLFSFSYLVVQFVADFCRPIFIQQVNRLHISICCDSVSFDFIKPATTAARFMQHSCLSIFNSVPYRKVRNRKCKQSSRRVGPCFQAMP